jgi:hypothetical protein
MLCTPDRVWAVIKNDRTMAELERAGMLKAKG